MYAPLTLLNACDHSSMVIFCMARAVWPAIVRVAWPAAGLDAWACDKRTLLKAARGQTVPAQRAHASVGCGRALRNALKTGVDAGGLYRV